MERANNPIVTIIVPVYNSKGTIARCVDSICSQSFLDWELLLIDDGSTDSSDLLCDRYAEKDKRIKVFHNNHSGVSVARNTGLDNAMGEWVTFVDSDDYIEDGYLSIDFGSSADMLVQNWSSFGEIVYYEKRFSHQMINNTMMLEFCSQNLNLFLFRGILGKFYRRSVLKQLDLKFDKRFKMGEDSLFLLKYISNIHSLELFDNSNYMCYSTRTWANKYTMPCFEAIEYLDEYWREYSRSPYKCEALLDII